jgi:predicted HTH domain antitoxin
VSVTFDLPLSVEEKLRREMGDLDQIAKQALAVEAFRAAKLSLGQFADLLGISTYEADGFLKARGVFLDLSETELGDERTALRKLRGA